MFRRPTHESVSGGTKVQAIADTNVSMSSNLTEGSTVVRDYVKTIRHLRALEPLICLLELALPSRLCSTVYSLRVVNTFLF